MYMAPSHKENHRQSESLFIKLAHGELGLNATFWRFGVLPLFIWTLLIAASYVRAELFFTMVLTLSFLLYSPFEVMGLIQSAKVYRGNKLWSHLAMFLAVFWMFAFIAFFFVFLVTL